MTAARIVLLLLVACAFSSSAEAQSRPTYFDEPAELRMVGTPTPGTRVPAIVFLQPTGGTSEDLLARMRSSIPLSAFIAILPKGRPTTSDYLPAFNSYVGWMETRVVADVERASTTLPVDPARIFLVGFSLGGDTSWALLLRKPELFRGALILGSRSSAQPRGNTLVTLRDRGARVAFGIGNSDDATRVAGITRAYEKIRDASVPTVLRRYDGAHQMPADSQTLGELAAFVLNES